jgi:hypothetical protein
MSPAVWIARLAEKEVGATGQAAPPGVEPPLFLSRDDFDDAVKQALQDFARPGGLTENPLLRSKLVLDVAGAAGKGTRERSEILRSKMSEAAEELRLHPRDEKLFRALDLTYFHPVGTQEVVSERLDLPFSTYRRHLTAGIQRLIEMLWQQETGQN